MNENRFQVTEMVTVHRKMCCESGLVLPVGDLCILGESSWNRIEE